MNIFMERVKKAARKISARYYYESRKRSHVSFTIEICTFCNLKCQFCPSRLEINQKGIRPLDDFEAILINLRKWLAEKNYNKCYISPGGLGEPFIIKNYVEYLYMVKKYIPNAIIHFNSNFTCITESQMEVMVRDNLVNEIGCSLNYGDRETYKRKCGVDLFDNVIHKIDIFVNNIARFKSDLILNLAMKKDKEIPLDKQEEFINFAAQRWPGIVKVHWNDILNWGGLIDVSNFIETENNRLNFPCYGLCLNYFLIDLANKIYPCISGLIGLNRDDICLGSINDDLKDINNKLGKLVKIHKNGQWKSLPPCRDCNNFALGCYDVFYKLGNRYL